MRDVAKMFSSVLPQLEIFKMNFVYDGLSLKDCIKFASAVEMNNLKQMVVNIYQCCKDRDYLLPVINLISASPCLQRFVLEAPRLRSETKDLLLDGAHANREVFKMIPRAYSSHLKEVEFVGYRGGISQRELIMHFVHYNAALENIVVDPRCFTTRLHRPWERVFQHNRDEEETFARAYAQEQLEEHVPSRINLKIL